MARTRKAKNEQPQTTAQSLGSLLKSARDIMRKDKGLNGDLDRLPMLTWIMFLKFLDDMEEIRETEAKLEGKRFRPVIASPYRWRDWAAKPDGISGDALISFINNEEATLPNGTRGAGLFAHLRSLQGMNGFSGRQFFDRTSGEGESYGNGSRFRKARHRRNPSLIRSRRSHSCPLLFPDGIAFPVA